MARYRGGAGEFNVQTGESMGSLLSEDNNDDDDENDDDDDETSDRDEEISEREICLAAYDKRTMAIGGDAETLPCGVAASDVVVKESNSNFDKNPPAAQTFHWTLSNWGSQTHRRNDSGTVRVDLASPEDISLDTDNSSRVVFSSYGTNV